MGDSPRITAVDKYSRIYFDMATKIALLCLALLAVARALPIDHFKPLDETVDTVETVDDNQAASDLDAAVNLQVKARQRARNRQRARCCHVHHRHSPHAHVPHVHVTTDKLDDAGREIKKGLFNLRRQLGHFTGREDRMLPRWRLR